ncbi:hypothetical protein COLO4_23951 [Corchorus olitorius]|uniref:Uncharacterized protein n=1 Tax=Corchorus olitorius TaxID=93759 RepID=A0A1R3IDU7_9ROSI|nr:hypothetical protein COLO4_23951 [Corchorus olitorius]
MALFPTLKSLHFDSGYDSEEMLMLEELGNLTNLEELSVENHPLYTNLLQDIGKLTSLRVLALTDHYYDVNLSIQGPLHLKKLESLTISFIPLGNNFLDKIGICDMTSLQELVITNSRLMGTLPDCFSNLISVRHLDLSSNQLSFVLLWEWRSIAKIPPPSA